MKTLLPNFVFGCSFVFASIVGCGSGTTAKLPEGKWILVAPKSMTDIEISVSTVKDGKVVTSNTSHRVPVTKTIEFTKDGYYIEERRAEKAILGGLDVRWKTASTETGVLELSSQSGRIRKLTVRQEGEHLIVDENSKRETYSRNSASN